MERPWIQFAKWSYEERMWHFEVAASDNGFAARQEFYADTSAILEFAEGLKEFPRSLKDEVEIEAGSNDPGWAHWVKLRAYVVDNKGHAGLIIETSNNSSDPYRRQAHFVIGCEAASLNGLGQKLLEWVQSEDEECRVELTRA